MVTAPVYFYLSVGKKKEKKKEATETSYFFRRTNSFRLAQNL